MNTVSSASPIIQPRFGAIFPIEQVVQGKSQKALSDKEQEALLHEILARPCDTFRVGGGSTPDSLFSVASNVPDALSDHFLLSN